MYYWITVLSQSVSRLLFFSPHRNVKGGMWQVCVSVWLLAIFAMNGGAQTLSCNSNISQPLCPGTVAKCTCTVTGTTSSTRWLFTTLNQCPSSSNFLTVVQAAPCAPPSPSSSGTCGPYLSAANNNPIGSSCPTSTLNITANPSLHGLVIECRDITGGLPGTLFGTGNISITAPPSAPTITSLTSTYSDQLTVTWTSVPTATSYSVSINSSSSTPVTITSSGPLQNTFTGLTSNTTYTVSVVAINCAGNNSAATVTNRTTSTQSTTSSSNTFALGLGVGLGVGIPVLLALVLVTVGVVYFCCCKGDSRSKISNTEGSPDYSEAPSKPPRAAKQTSPPSEQTSKPAPPKQEGLVYADVGVAKAKSQQAPKKPDADSGVAYSSIKHE